MAKKGQLVSIPKGGGVHQFKNASSSTVRVLCMVVPAGLDAFFLEVGQLLTPGGSEPPQEMGPDEQKRLKAIAERYGQELYPPDYFDKRKAN